MAGNEAGKGLRQRVQPLKAKPLMLRLHSVRAVRPHQRCAAGEELAGSVQGREVISTEELSGRGQEKGRRTIKH